MHAIERKCDYTNKTSCAETLGTQLVNNSGNLNIYINPLLLQMFKIFNDKVSMRKCKQ